jgi:alkylation response protein AidB-like acyl-CoA dehydrogenase
MQAMSHTWTPEQLDFQKSVLAFARNELDSASPEARGFSRELWKKCAAFGIQGLPVPDEFGGSGADAMTTMLAMEALGRGCRDNGLLFSLHAHMWAVLTPILRFGTAEQKAKWLPGLVDGTLVGAHGMTEPDSGSDSFSLRAKATKRGDEYVLSGSKTFVTNAPVADVFIVFATTDRAKGMWGVTGFILPKDTPGLTVSRPIHKMGLKTSPMGEVVMTECVVPAAARLGREGQGSAIFNHSMGWERSCILASAVGGMERQLDASLEYAKTRKQFGKSIGSFQLVATKLVDMKMRLDTSRLLLYRTAWSHAQGTITPLEAAMAKLYISESAVASGLDAIQVHGGWGYTEEYGLERDLRDAIGGRLYSGTSEIQRLIIARGLGLTTEN